MTTEKMVVRLKDKSILKGITSDFSPRKTIFSLKLLNGELIKINTEKMKAAFYVKTFDGNKKYEYLYRDVFPWEGNKVKVKFLDGEIMIGYVSHLLNNKENFYITPADKLGNNKRAFVVTSATSEITYL